MTSLTDRQREVLALVALGYQDKAISLELEMSPRRVRTIIARLACLLAVDESKDRRVQLTRWWIKQAA